MTGDLPNGGLGISATERLRRIEANATHMADKVDAIGAELSAVLKDQAIQTRTIADHERRIRNLDFKFYGILAGVCAFAGIIIYNGGRPPG